MATYILVQCKCKTCRKVYKGWWPKEAEDNPPCTFCFPPEPWTPTSFAITGNKSRAVDMAWKVASEQYGLTDMKDNTRVGETAVKLTPTQSEMVDQAALATKMVKDPLSLTTTQKHQMEKFWGGNGKAGNPLALPSAQTLINGAKAGAQAARAEGLNPMTLLQSSIKAQRKQRGMF